MGRAGRARSRVIVLIGVALGLGAMSGASTASAQDTATGGSGPAHDGLEAGTATCPSSFEVEGTGLCTHGPDPKPDSYGPDVEPPGGGPAMPPLCVTNGTEGPRVQVIYAAPAGATNRYDSVVSNLRSYARAANRIYHESARQGGEARGIRFVTNSACQIEVANVTFDSINDDDSFSSEIQELQRQGYGSTSRLYMVFLDKNVPGCGIGNIFDDSRPGPVNTGNFGPRYGRADLGCWGGAIPAHELMHNLGGVQLDAPHSTGFDGVNGYHCWDEQDRMCENDGGTYFDNGGTLQTLCDTTGFDCNDDDYYSTGVPTGYLSNHWNTANSAFLHNDGFSTTSGDFNGDGMDDIASFERASSGGVYVSLSTGTGFAPKTQWHDSLSYGSAIPLIGDFNGDGRDDIASFTRRRTGDVVVALSNGSSFAEPPVRWRGRFALNDQIPAVGDVTCDGKDDILAFNRGGYGDVFVGRSTGSSFGARTLWHSDFAYGNDIPVVGDFTGGDCDDIAVFRRGYPGAPDRGDVSVARSNGSTAFGPLTRWHDLFGVNFDQISKGDFNADGRDDIVAFRRGAAGDVLIATSTGSAFGAAAVWHTDFAYHRDLPGVGDFDGGHGDDVLMFQPGLSSYAAYVALSDGTRFGGRSLWRSGFTPLVTLPLPATVY